MLERNADLVARSDLVVVAVKPGLVQAVLEDVVAADRRRASAPLWISIAAGPEYMSGLGFPA